jgi:UDP-N-acetylmuramoyl-L-alanyl-D-glutamate--2,6-diaminopimelate ligase
VSETTLGTLLAGLDGALDGRFEKRPQDAKVAIRDLAVDSREVAPGVLFLARRGEKNHGLRFAPEAIRRGAAAVVYDPTEAPRIGSGKSPEAIAPAPELVLPEPHGPLVSFPGLEAALAEIARRFYGDVTRELSLTAVTGTNGKTTVAWLLAQAWRLVDPASKPAYLGTLGIERASGERTPQERTTPDVIGMHRWCARLRDEGTRRLVCEASSHALVQGRLDGLRVATAVFTNLSPEHLDYHRTIEDYREAKGRLFARPELRRAAINVGDASGRLFADRLAARPSVTLVRFAVGSVEADVRAENVAASNEGTRFDLLGPGGERRTIETGLRGLFNVENLLAVAAALHAEGVPCGQIATVLGALRAPPGRLEFVRPARGPAVVVDYAHTPAALAAVLSTCRGLTRGRLLVVFGCGGERDRGKRPVMGRLAVTHADRVILTDDNPRNEDPRAIVAEILAGIPADAAPVSVVHDRTEAIAQALAEAAPEDLVLVAGKGHEEIQVYGAQERPHSDLAVVRACLGEGGDPC